MLKKGYILALLFLLGALGSRAGALLTDSTSVKTTPASVSLPSSDIRRFDQFHIPIGEADSDPILIPEQIPDDSTQYFRSRAQEYQQEVMRRNAMVGNLNELYSLELPVGLASKDGNPNYAVIITEISGDAKGPILEAYFMFELPQTGDKIAFRGRNIKFSHDGGLIGTGRMELIGSYPIKLNDKTLLTILGKGNTFVEFDCNGFKGMGIEGEVEFSRDLIIPEDDQGKLKPSPERVKTKFVTVAQSWSDLLVGVTFPPFQVNGLKDVGFSVSQAFMDWSDLANPPGLMFPSGYSNPFVQVGQQALWQGFYLQRLDVKLPPSFSKKQGNGRVAVGVENVILDDQGFTGTVFAENVLTAGDMSGWAYTIDRVGLELVINQVKGFELAGTISVPRIKMKDNETATHFGYLAQRSSDGNFIFAVKVENNLRLPLFMADVNLYPGSSIIVKEKDSKFYPSAILNGDLSIKNVKANFNQIRFEGMVISSEDPKFDIKTLGFGGGEGQSVSKFPVVISDISIKKETKKLGIGFNLTINIGGKPSEEGFGGTAALTVWSKNEPTDVKDAEGTVIRKEDDWKFDKVELSGVGINIKKPNAYELAGTIIFFDADPMYGDGFRGTLTGSISKFGGIEATALFGRTENFRYWYADALVKLKTGVPLIPGALFATGFGGGVYSKMKQTDKSPGSSLGETRSGIYYVPDENMMGIKAIMNIGTARPEAMNGDVGLEVAINKHGGINSVTLTGNANFMSLAELAEGKMKELAASAAAGKLSEKLGSLMKGQVFGSMKLMFDNENDVFHGNLEIFINVAGGLVKGIGSNGRAGWAVLHFEKTDWYVLIGTPDQPLGLEVAKIFKSKSYFMLGKNLPGSPPPPSQVTEILGNVDLDYMRDMNALQSGTGFAFGLHFLVDTGDLTFLMFYGRFAAGTGVDFMLKDYGTQYHCEGSSGPFGINGWYANGQAYAFVSGKIGIKVNLKFYKGRYDIISVGAAAILQTKGPNPFWMKGIVGGYYKILGGMVKGQCKFEVVVGKDCKPVGEQNLLEDVNMIAAVSPSNGSTEVDVFNAPQAAFNVPMNEVWEIVDQDNRQHYFRAALNEFSVLDGTQAITGSLQWNENNDVVIFDSRDLLPGEKKLRARARLVFEEKIGGIWQPVKFAGKIVEEVSETTFTTGKAPDYIPDDNILYAYPVARQTNFHPGEYGQGFLQLKSGQPYLFNPGPEWIQKIRMTDVKGQNYVESDLTYNASEKRISFPIPSGLANSKIFRFEILNIPRQSTIIDANVQKVEQELTASSGENTATLTTKKIEGELDKLEVKSIYSNGFRTSKYNTFSDKVRSINLGTTYRLGLDINVFRLMAYLKGDEAWDDAELNGGVSGQRLIQMEAELTGNSWYERYVHPLVYESYPLFGWMKMRRDANLLGVPPVRDIHFVNAVQRQALTDDDLTFIPFAFTDDYIAYDLGVSVAADYRDLQQQTVNYVADHPQRITPRLSKLILEPIPYVRQGQYRFKINYVIPGINKVTSSFEWELNNKLRDND